MSNENEHGRPEGRPEWIEASADSEEIESLLDDVADTAERPGSLGRVRAFEPTLDHALAWRYSQAFDSFKVAACAISSHLDPTLLVKEILTAAVRSLGAERGILFLGRSEAPALVPVAASNVRGEELDTLERVSRTILQRGQAGEVLIVPDAARDPSLRCVPSIPLKSVRSVLCAPLRRRDETIGVIYLDAASTRWSFPEGVGQFLRAFADLAAIALENARSHQDARREVRRLRLRAAADPFDRIVTVSPTMRELLKRTAMAAAGNTPVLLIGETGTGKGLLARCMHDVSARSEKPFVHFNCAAVPEGLMENIFFGRAKGGYTGAHRDTPGLFREADQGTLFLDEVSKMTPEVQSKLLQATDEGVARPVGGTSDYRVDTRLITASLADLHERMREGRFLKELYHRISVIELRIPPLRERAEDIPVLVDHFLLTLAGDQGPASGVHMTPEALEHLQTLPWKGNVRELKNTVQRILVFADRPLIDADQVRRFASSHPSEHGDHGGSTGTPAHPSAGIVVPLAELEREALQRALTQVGGNKSEAARLLGLHRNSLLRKLEKHGIHTSS